MSTDLISLQSKLLKGNLPVLDATLERFQKISEQQTTNHQHLAEIIRSDIGFTLAMFRSINTMLPAGRDPVSSIEHAISMNGVPRTLSIGEELIKISALPEQAQKNLKAIYSQSMHASQYFTAMAIQSGLVNPDPGSKNIKLMNLAEVLLWTNESDFMASYEGLLGVSSETVPAALLDLSMRGLGLAIARDWKLPEDLQQALLPYDESNSSAMTMITANEIARQTAINWHTDAFKALMEFWCEKTETPVSRFENTLHQLAAETARQTHGRDLPQPAFGLFFPAPPKTDAGTEPGLDKTATQEKPAAPKEKVDSLDKKPTKKQAASTHPKAQPKAQKTAPKSGAKPSPFQSIMTEKMRDMQQMCGAERVMFAMLTPDRKKLAVKYVLGGNKEDALRKYQLDMSQKTLCSILMTKPQSAHLNKTNYKKYLQLIPEPTQQAVNYKNMFAMSIFVKGKPIGLFLIDSQEKQLNTNQYNNFKKICNQAAEMLSGKKG